MLEEEIFYPAVRAQLSDEEDQAILNEAEVEHETVEELIGKLQELDPGEPMYSAYFKILSEYVKRHVREEEKTLFAQVKKLKELDLHQLGEDMRLRREELFGEMESDEEDMEDDEDSDATMSEDAEELEDEGEQSEPPSRH